MSQALKCVLTSQTGENIFNVATVKGECVKPFCRLSEVQMNEDPSYFDNSEMNCNTLHSSTIKVAIRRGVATTKEIQRCHYNFPNGKREEVKEL